MMRRRPSSRLLLLDPRQRVLLFRFVHTRGALAGRSYWATPGGALEAGETFADAARRELFEETGIVVEALGAVVAVRTFPLRLTDGEWVLAEEHFFVVRTNGTTLSTDRWTANEIEVMADHRWWPIVDLASTHDTIYPTDLVDILAGVGIRANG